MKGNGLPKDDSGMEQARRVAFLITGYLRQTLSRSDHDELDAWVEASDDNMRLFEELTDKRNIEEGLRQMKEMDMEQAYQRIRARIHFTTEKPSLKLVRLWPWAVAASVIIVAGLLIYKLNSGGERKGESQGQSLAQKDLSPGGNRAILTLSDGKLLTLDDTKNGIIKIEHGTEIKKTTDGELSYTPSDQLQSELKYNTLATPRGGQYKVQLPDGTLVWLNAASSLRYPIAFIGNERIVELTGEGYFEVAKDPSKKFIVQLKNKSHVDVLGTHFNIMAYEDEKNIETTLIEGKVDFHSASMNLLMSPGWQSSIEPNGTISTDKNVNTGSVIAWKDGIFRFKDATLESIMKQVGRWYNVDIVYEKPISYHFNATIPRNVPVSRLFHLLEMTESVHFDIQGKKIIVKP